ncbi:HugZ family protein [Cognatishimia sp. MH4019]|uniref:HugZ family pyridoxamine 5'-phosphate oxidase n=1 Tax=Cognatishimia sp. MH4019 TaxID=2854030 RepID=UPI001CD72261|nr:pyridoxamine 5'-phosphate oxidase family protein [Cognatishimia sp. MH4019]
MPEINPIRETTDEARTLARGLISKARFGAIGVIDPDTAMPMVSRIAVGQAPNGTPLTLISDLSSHTKALKADPHCSLLVGEPEEKGDPLTHPRLTLQCKARFIAHSDAAYKEMRGHYLTTHPKAKLYIDFADFSFALFDVQDAHLNGGFGKAFRLTPADLA